MSKVRSKTKEISKKGRVGVWLSYLIPSVLVVACFVLELVLAQPVYAAVFNVGSGDAEGLINAINTANSNGQDNTINLAAGTYTLTAVDNDTDGPNGLPSIIGKITIKGAGAGTSIIERHFSSPSVFRIFHIAATGTLTLDGLTITGGQAPPNPSQEGGGGILNNGGKLNINNTSLHDNAEDLGGGILNLAGIATLNNTTIYLNLAQGACGGLENDGEMNITNSIVEHNFANDEGGGGICNFSVMTITKSSISFNAAIVVGGILNNGTMEVTKSIISNNGANNFGGGIDNQGQGRLTITDSTFTGNGDGEGFGIFNFGDSTMTITNSTIAEGNTQFDSDGVFNTEGGTFELQNTILSFNKGVQEFGPECSGPITSLGNNLIGDTSGCTITLLATDLTGDPGLGTFTDNGMPGNGHFPLLPNSQAINAGNNAVCLANRILATDQIGDPRVGICDIGSIEFEPFKNLGDCILTLIQENCSGLQGQSQSACNKEQQTFCFNLFNGK